MYVQKFLFGNYNPPPKNNNKKNNNKKIINPRGTKKPLTKEGYNYIKVAMNTLYSGMSS